MDEFKPFELPKKQGFHLDPRTKIFLMATITTLLFYEHNDILFIGVLELIPCCLLFANKQRRPAFVFSGLVILAIVLKFTREVIMLPIILNAVTGMFVGLVIRLFPILILGEYLIKSTSVDEFVAAMKRMNVSNKFTIPVSVAFRFVPTIAEEFQSITYAMKIREISFGSKRFRKKPGTYIEYRIIPLIMSIVKIGEELSAAALTKGLGSKTKRQSIAAVGFGIYDLSMLLIALGLIVWVVHI